MRRSIVFLVAATCLLASCGLSAGEEPECPTDAACAARNPEAVPKVVGLPLEKACRALTQAGYNGGVKTVLERNGRDSTLVVSQGTQAGKKGYEGDVIMLSVSRPLKLTNLPRGCVDRTS
jgi:hypothetical protein